MTAAVFDTMNVKIEQNGVQFTANGSQVKFDGYLAIYNDSDKIRCFQIWKKGDTVKRVNTNPEQHFTSHLLAILKLLLSRLSKKMELAGRLLTHRPLRPFKNAIMLSWFPSVLNQQNLVKSSIL